MRTSFEADSKTLSLDGEWKFNGCLNPDSRQKGFHETDFDDSAWGATPLKEYMLEDTEYTFTLIMAPYSASE